jgi:hypothetical protein
MDIAAADTLEPNAIPHTAQASPKQYASPVHTLDKRAAARIAKKKRRRKAHRATLKRSHTDG